MKVFVLKHKTNQACYLVSVNCFSTNIKDALIFQTEYAAENFAQLQEDMNRGSPLEEESTNYDIIPYDI